jgi:ferredoxin
MNKTKKKFRVQAFCFSPGGTTKKIVEHILKGLNASEQWTDLTRHDQRIEIVKTSLNIREDIDCAVFAMPVYGAAIPTVVLKSLKRIRSINIPAIIIINYGNRDFGMSLKNLSKIITKQGFKIVGAAAFISQHSFFSRYPIAVGRPDIDDLQNAVDFGKDMHTKLLANSISLKNEIPGKHEFFVSMLPKNGPVPELNGELCTHCGICMASCPLALLASDTKMFISQKLEKKCLGCMSCVNRCPQKARYFAVPKLMDIFLNKFFSRAMSLKEDVLIVQ